MKKQILTHDDRTDERNCNRDPVVPKLGSDFGPQFGHKYKKKLFATMPDSRITHGCHGLFLTCENKH
jgi:hypothetical protein